MADDLEVVGEADSGERAIQLFRDPAFAVDVVIMDLKMPGPCDGVEAIRTLTSLRPSLRILALTSFDDDASAAAALAAGAVGYLQKDVAPDILLGGIRQATAGKMVLERHVWNSTQRVRQTADQASPGRLREALTDRELDVLRAMARGLSNKEIAAALGISEKTVKVHVSHILGKMEVLDRTQAVLLAAKLRLVKID
jgi:NarL family two-component system response regulator LiaR